ncbi:MAG: hypothetical protein ABIF92_03240 [archaeon]
MAEKPNVLIVDDDIDNRKWLAKSLSKKMPGINIIHATEPKKAIKVLQKQKIQVMLCDMNFEEYGYKSSKMVVGLTKACVERGGKPVLFSIALDDFFESHFNKLLNAANIEGIPMLDNDVSELFIDDVLEEVKKGIKQKRVPRKLSPEFVKEMYNPKVAEYIALLHKMSPSEKAHPELSIIRRKINQADKEGNWPKRDLNKLVDEYHSTVKKIIIRRR